MKRFLLSLFVLVAGFSVSAAPASAVELQLLPACATTLNVDPTAGPVAGSCTSCDMLTLFGNWAEILAYAIVVPVVFFIALGGVWWLTSGGSAERVEQGRKMIVGAIVGLLIVYFGYTIVNFSIAAVTGQTNLNKEVKLFGTEWNNVCNKELSRQAVTDCADAVDGTSCNADGCFDHNFCACASGTCETQCSIQVEQQDSTRSGHCNTTCSANQTPSSLAGVCPNNTICCESVN